MMFAITDIPFREEVLLNDDEDTPKRMIGKKMVPILQREDGSFMGESMDIVRFLNIKEKVLSDKKIENIITWIEDSMNYVYSLFFPRVIQADLPEFATESARQYFCLKKEKSLGMSFQEALALSNDLRYEAEVHLKMLSSLIRSIPSKKAKNFSENDIMLFPILHMLSIVKNLKMEDNVKVYLQNIAAELRIPLYKAVL